MYQKWPSGYRMNRLWFCRHWLVLNKSLYCCKIIVRIHIEQNVYLEQNTKDCISYTVHEPVPGPVYSYWINHSRYWILFKITCWDINKEFMLFILDLIQQNESQYPLFLFISHTPICDPILVKTFCWNNY